MPLPGGSLAECVRERVHGTAMHVSALPKTQRQPETTRQAYRLWSLAALETWRAEFRLTVEEMRAIRALPLILVAAIPERLPLPPYAAQDRVKDAGSAQVYRVAPATPFQN